LLVREIVDGKFNAIINSSQKEQFSKTVVFICEIYRWFE